VADQRRARDLGAIEVPQYVAGVRVEVGGRDRRVVVVGPQTDSVAGSGTGWLPIGCQFMPVRGQARRIAGVTSYMWPSGGRHLWPSGETSAVQSHARGHLVYAASGVLAVHTERGTSIVPANRVAWTPAGFTHYDRAHGDTDMRIVFLAPSLARLMPDHPAVFLASGLAREVLLALTGPHNYDDTGPEHSRSARTRLLRVLVEELREAPEQPLQLPEPRDDRLQAVARMLYENPADNASLAKFAKTTGASTRTLSRLFRKELGMTFYEWRTQLRIYHALVLLGDGHDATQTAYACGWANPSSFIAAFTNIIGTTPGRHRTSRQHHATP
jgi:AraC-like DNA-binding protein